MESEITYSLSKIKDFYYLFECPACGEIDSLSTVVDLNVGEVIQCSECLAVINII